MINSGVLFKVSVIFIVTIFKYFHIEFRVYHIYSKERLPRISAYPMTSEILWVPTSKERLPISEKRHSVELSRATVDVGRLNSS